MCIARTSAFGLADTLQPHLGQRLSRVRAKQRRADPRRRRGDVEPRMVRPQLHALRQVRFADLRVFVGELEALQERRISRRLGRLLCAFIF